MTAPRIAFLHTGAVNIASFGALAAEFLPGVTVVNYLDDRIVADLGDETRAASVPERVEDLVRAAASGGADAVMFTCSSISELAAPAAAAIGVSVLRVDEAMADAAVAAGRRIRVLATLPTTCRPTLGLIEERAALAGTAHELSSEVIDGAFEAIVSGDRETHDHLVGAAIERGATEADVIVLAQASMATAAESVSVDVPVLTSPRLGVERLALSLGAR
ncbi:aspartate/glutamate racemase family protein [Microbacterium sp.]|uniref:aspartate/glutamate racemase family protein n=1 Tax=Microbacterium sp. TaxID=51671 RepID=UPI002734C078|nr:aspartate/glutamate racemase family protein [Microbacterium sp.]MDP3949429.1 aspartate/glutamate racemase family protein [Microbacterium sp.]